MTTATPNSVMDHVDGRSAGGKHTLEAGRQSFSRILVGLVWLNAGLAGLAAYLSGQSTLLSLSLGAALATITTALYLTGRTGLIGRQLMSVAAIGSACLIVSSAVGARYQLDLHMYIFATMAVLAAWCDWRVFPPVVVAVAIHHLGLNYAYPSAVFPNGADLSRVVLHAAIVVIEAGVLIRVAWQQEMAFAGAETLARNMASDAIAAKDDAETRAEALRTQQARDSARGQTMDTAIAEFAQHIEALLSQVAARADEMTGAANTLIETADAGTTQAADAQGAATNAVAGIDALNAASGELSSATQEIASRIQEAASLAAEASQGVVRTDGSVNALTGAANEVSEIIALIRDVAEQTNLLALNATIEAARAGDAGKGFAVVASEVKALADQTAHATKSISDRISAMVKSTEETAGSIRTIRKSIEDVNEINTAIATAVEEQNAITQTMSTDIGQASERVHATSRDVTTLGTGVEHTRDASRQVLGASQAVGGLASELDSAIGSFLAKVKAA